MAINEHHGSDVSPPHGSKTKGRRSARHEASRRHGLPRSGDIGWLAAWRFLRLKPIPVAGSSRLLSVTRCCSLTLLAFNNQQRQSNKRVTSPSYVSGSSAAHFSAASRSSQSSS